MTEDQSHLAFVGPKWNQNL